MTFNSYIEVQYVDNDPNSAFYDPIPTAGASLGDACKDLSTGEWYIFDGADWVLSYAEITTASSCQIIDVEFVLDSNILFDGFAAQIMDMRYATSDTTIFNDVATSLVNDRVGIIRMIKR